VQEDVILDTMTVREALTFAAELKLPREMSHEDKVRGSSGIL
jgi:ABC-type multidrug transport system ATPase subunit